ncbi:MAG: hypothetical protein JO208_10190 [Alphaproteobacteria bacterium]|nr:hypothetical protein [Alphaproteobacteria bacterium]
MRKTSMWALAALIGLVSPAIAAPRLSGPYLFAQRTKCPDRDDAFIGNIVFNPKTKMAHSDLCTYTRTYDFSCSVLDNPYSNDDQYLMVFGETSNVFYAKKHGFASAASFTGADKTTQCIWSGTLTSSDVERAQK